MPPLRVCVVLREGRGGFAMVGQNTTRRSGIPTTPLSAVLQYYEVFEELSTLLF